MALMQSCNNGKGELVGAGWAQWASELVSMFGTVRSTVRFVIVRGRVSAKTVRWYGINDRRIET